MIDSDAVNRCAHNPTVMFDKCFAYLGQATRDAFSDVYSKFVNNTKNNIISMQIGDEPTTNQIACDILVCWVASFFRNFEITYLVPTPDMKTARLCDLFSTLSRITMAFGIQTAKLCRSLAKIECASESCIKVELMFDERAYRGANCNIMVIDGLSSIAETHKDWIEKTLPCILHLSQIHGVVILPHEHEDLWKSSYAKFVLSLNQFNKPGSSEIRNGTATLKQLSYDILSLIDARIKCARQLDNNRVKFGYPDDDDKTFIVDAVCGKTSYIREDALRRIFAIIDEESKNGTL